uniref:Xaa-Pro dipeptidase n=2 Tax=Wuchereria bancrofti TaxID=6293 RepID=A0AAF5RUV3_WUCBA
MSFTMGNETFTVTAKLFTENRLRLVKMLKNKVQPGSVIVLKGGIEQNRYNTDAMDLPFRQESYFFWTFGVHESNCFGAIDIDSGKSFLFPPRLHPDFAIWHGNINNEEWYQKKYEVDEVHFNDQNIIIETLTNLHAKHVLLLKANNSDSNEILEPPTIDGLNNLSFDTAILYPIMAELRIFKTDYELDVMRYVCKVASEAHKAVMKAIKPGIYEYQLESLFRHHCYYYGGCRHLAYTCIASSGCNSAILHYGHENAPNTKKIIDGDLCLFDMGPEYNCYASDITTTFPCNGKFTEKQKMIYNAVLAANIEVFQAAKPGLRWNQMHILAERIILSHLKDAGILCGDLDEMIEARIGAIFMPHGLGHFMGLDVHDCGGYLGDAEPRSILPGLKALRTTRTLRERMVITIEPGCYFIDTLLDAALNDSVQNKFIIKEKLNEFRGFGGVRIEDDIVIWSHGNERMSNVPRTVDEIEQFMSKDK